MKLSQLAVLQPKGLHSDALKADFHCMQARLQGTDIVNSQFCWQFLLINPLVVFICHIQMQP